MFENFKKNIRVLSRLKSYVWTKGSGIRFRFLGSIFLTVVSAVLNVIAPVFLKKSIDMISSNEDANESLGIKFGAISFLIFYGSLWTLGQGTGFTRSILMSKVIHRTNRELTRKTIEHLSALSLPFRESASTGALNEAIHKAQQGAGRLIQNVFGNIIPIVLEITLASGLILRFYGLKYALGATSMLFAYGLFTVKASNWSKEALVVSNKDSSKATSQITDILLNFDTVEYFNNTAFEIAQCEQLLEKQECSSVNSDFMSNMVLLGQSLILGIGLTVITVLHGKETLAGVYQVSDFVLLNNYLIQFIWPLNALGFFLRDVKHSFIDLSALMDILDLEPTIVNKLTAGSPEISESSIIFDRVYFNYSNGKEALINVSFVAPAGKKTAIVGESGSGKTTISRVLLRFYDVKSGSISIGPQKINTMRLEYLRSLISFIPQETGIFNRSLGYNIQYGNLSATEGEIQKAVNDSQLKTVFYRSSGSYTSVEGERGVKLSGGEKQRVGICRALLKKPQQQTKIYLLDEMTSSLDATNEKMILDTFDKVTRGSTVLTITHRLAASRNADQILVMDKGRIVQCGIHDTLIKDKKGVYFKMWQNQFFSKEDESIAVNDEVLSPQGDLMPSVSPAAEIKVISMETSFPKELPSERKSYAPFFKPLHEAKTSLPVENQENQNDYYMLEETTQKKRCVVM